MTKILNLVVLIYSTSIILTAQCENEYFNNEWKLNVCIPNSWYPKVESNNSITFFGDSIYHLKIDREIRTSTYKLKDMLATNFSKELSKDLELIKIDSTIENTFIATYLSKDKVIETSFAVKQFDAATLYFQLVKKKDIPYTHLELIRILRSINLKTDKTTNDSTLKLEIKRFEKALNQYVFNYDLNSQLTINQEIWSELNKLYPSNKNTQSFDFLTYWQNSRKSFCDSISTLSSPKISHFNISFEKNNEMFPSFYQGELFITHDTGLIKSRFTTTYWKDQLYLINIIISD